MKDPGLAIGIAILGQQIPSDKPLEDRLRFAMQYIRKNWRDVLFMAYNADSEDLQFRTAVGAVMAAGDADDLERLSTSLKPMRMLNAAATGIPVNFSDLPDPEDVLPLASWWKESAETP